MAVWKKMEMYDTDRMPQISWQQVMQLCEAKNIKVTKAQAKKIARTPISQEQWRNDLYNVAVNREMNDQFGAVITELAITRHDKAPAHDWRHFQYIKNDVCGENVEAMEIYPNENRLMDTANTYWLYAFPADYVMPFGFHTPRNVSDENVARIVGAVQRGGE